jgi:hypothetical protein
MIEAAGKLERPPGDLLKLWATAVVIVGVFLAVMLFVTFR